jgi:hypothetical protein
MKQNILVIEKSALIEPKGRLTSITKPDDQQPIPGMQARIKELAADYQIFLVGNEPQWKPTETLAQNFPIGAHLYDPLAANCCLVTNKIDFPKEVRLTLNPTKEGKDHTYIPRGSKVLFQWKTSKLIAQEYQYALELFPEIDQAYFSGDKTVCFLVTRCGLQQVKNLKSDWDYNLPNPGMLWLAAQVKDNHLEKGEHLFISKESAYKQKIDHESGFLFMLQSELL